MDLPIKLFAGMKATAGTSELRLVLPEGATVADLRLALRAAHPELAGWIERSRVAVNQAFVAADHPLGARDEVALIPPVSGG